MLCESAAVRESRAAAPTDVRFCAGMSELVSAESLLRLERLSATCADVAAGSFRLVDDLVSVQCGGSLERLAARAAGERPLRRVHRRVSF